MITQNVQIAELTNQIGGGTITIIMLIMMSKQEEKPWKVITLSLLDLRVINLVLFLICLFLSQRAACSASMAVATENVSTRLKEGNKKRNHNSPLYSNKSGNRSDIHLNHEQIIILAHKI